MKQSLYNINEEQLKLVEQLMQNEGEITPEIEEQLALNEKNLRQKSVAYMEVISNQEMKVSAIDSEIKRLQALKKSKQNIVNRLKENLLLAVKTFGTFEVGTLKFGTRKSTVLEMTEGNISAIPSEFKTSTTTVKVDKTAIKKFIAIKGNEIDGCKLVTNLNLKIN